MSKSTRLPNVFWRLWSATSISNLGDGIASVAYPWLASATTRSPFLIALITLAQRLPWLIFTLPAGVITDRYEAITYAVSLCQSGDTLLVLGKGHENGQEIKGEKIDFDDRLVLGKILEESR